MKTVILRENKNLRQNKIYIPTLCLLSLIGLFIYFFNWIYVILISLLSVYVFYRYILPHHRHGIYITDKSISIISSYSNTEFLWKDITLLKHDLRIKYHILSIIEGDRTLHISMEDYNPDEVINEILKHIPREKIDSDSVKNLERYYYYGRTIDKLEP